MNGAGPKPRRAPWLAGAAGAGGLLAGGLAYAALYPPSQIFGPVIVAGHDPREIALTFDDGPNPAATPWLLDVLARHGVRATFFLIGRFAQGEPALAREIAAAGHALGCHSMSHPRLAWQSARHILDEIGRSQAVVEDVTGQPVRLFRPPHGARRPLVLRTAHRLGMATVQWNCTGLDWIETTAEGVLRRALRGIAGAHRRGRGANLLLHDGGHLALGTPRLHTVGAVNRLLTLVPPRNARYVTVENWTAA